jgi:hypothetical protein
VPVTGTLVAESLTVESTITVPLVLRRLHRIAVGTVAQDQPTHWTLIDFTCPVEEVDRFAAQLAAALLPGPWYADYATESTKYVVFAGKVFAYPRGDEVGRASALAYAREVGV